MKIGTHGIKAIEVTLGAVNGIEETKLCTDNKQVARFERDIQYKHGLISGLNCANIPHYVKKRYIY